MRRARSRVHVLVVEPEASVCQELAHFVEGLGYQITALTDPHGAVDQVRNGRIPLVLLDLEGEGLEVLGRLRALDRDLCVIAMTGRPSVESAVAAMKGQAFEYLPKPVEPERLRRALAEAVREKGLHVDPEDRIAGEIGRQVRARRSERRLTLKQVATRTGLSVSLISQIELGKSAASLSTLHRLARALRVRMTYFFETV